MDHDVLYTSPRLHRREEWDEPSLSLEDGFSGLLLAIVIVLAVCALAWLGREILTQVITYDMLTLMRS